VEHSLESTTEQAKIGARSGKLVARNSDRPRRSAWAKAGRRFDPPVNIEPLQAMGLWVHGDGSGQLLNVQLRSAPQFWNCYAEHYVTLDFTGWRYVELLLRERDAERFAQYEWPYGQS
jgi:hypothetical protein